MDFRLSCFYFIAAIRHFKKRPEPFFSIKISDPVDCNLTGRNQEFALAAALSALKDIPYAYLLSANTGGEDGSFHSKYSGAIVSAKTAAQIDEFGIDAIEELIEHRATPVLEKIGATYKNGKFNSNLLDLVIAIASDK